MSISNKNINKLTNLKLLKFYDESEVTGRAIRKLTKLETLRLCGHEISNKDINMLTNLKKLYLDNCEDINKSKLKLPNLVKFVQDE